MFPLQTVLIACAAALVFGFGGGWAVNGWKLGEKVANLEGTVRTQKQGMESLEGANKSCLAGLEDVKKSVSGFIEASDKRSAAAAAEMASAAKSAAAHHAAAKAAMNRPPVAAGKGCEAAIAEALAYAKRRKEAQQ